jgi:tetratricopeptide (TPR) repeat protein
MNRGDEALEAEDGEGALREYGEAQRLYPDSEEIRFWSAVSLVNAGRFEQALPIFAELFGAHQNWATLADRIYELGLLKTDQQGYERVVASARAGRQP